MKPRSVHSLGVAQAMTPPALRQPATGLHLRVSAEHTVQQPLSLAHCVDAEHSSTEKATPHASGWGASGAPALSGVLVDAASAPASAPATGPQSKLHAAVPPSDARTPATATPRRTRRSDPCGLESAGAALPADSRTTPVSREGVRGAERDDEGIGGGRAKAPEFGHYAPAFCEGKENPRPARVPACEVQ